MMTVMGDFQCQHILLQIAKPTQNSFQARQRRLEASCTCAGVQPRQAASPAFLPPHLQASTH